MLASREQDSSQTNGPQGAVASFCQAPEKELTITLVASQQICTNLTTTLPQMSNIMTSPKSGDPIKCKSTGHQYCCQSKVELAGHVKLCTCRYGHEEGGGQTHTARKGSTVTWDHAQEHTYRHGSKSFCFMTIILY